LKTKKSVVNAALAAMMLTTPVAAQQLQWTAKEKQVIVRGSWCQTVDELAPAHKGSVDTSQIVARSEHLMADNYGLSPTEAIELWNNERHRALAGQWSVQSCPSYERQMRVLLRRASKEKRRRAKLTPDN
jgi:hypothetical protein